MQPILAVTVPFFALVLCGWLAARAQVLPTAAIPGLNAFVLYFALPCMLFRFGAGLPVAQLLDPWVLGIYVVVALAIVGATIALTLSDAVRHKDAAFGALVAAFPNTGFMGVPLLTALLGPAAAGPVIATILADLFVTSSLCIAIAQGHEAAGHGARRAAVSALRGALSNPLPWAIAAGALASATGLVLPGPVDEVVRMLGNAASPVALFTIGAVLWRAQQHATAPTPVSAYVPVALIKLVVHPLLVLGGAFLANAAGSPLSQFTLIVLVLNAALPSASNVAILAERYGADSGRVTRIIMASTVLAFVTFSLIAWAFGVRK
jgi:malonate transporter